MTLCCASRTHWLRDVCVMWRGMLFFCKATYTSIHFYIGIMQVSPSRLAATEDEELPSGSQLAGAASGGSATAAEAAAKARGKLVSALMKRHLVEQVRVHVCGQTAYLCCPPRSQTACTPG